ncbi:hypothetical protein GQ53DRAFT_822611 [Thozetella sp. PMI_491]|nr:hypothetical protein GQ53DRAFT_822611 [Thozetella sp. PMI_491]
MEPLVSAEEPKSLARCGNRIGRAKSNPSLCGTQEHEGDVLSARDSAQIPWFSKVDPHWNPARPLSATEAVLLDHYIGYVVMFLNGSCHSMGCTERSPQADENFKARFASMQLKCWLPFALADLGLLTSLLLQSCRSLKTLSRFETYDSMYTAYRGQCIRLLNKSLSSKDTRLSDTTIAMVMVLVGESYSLGNLKEWKLHLCALTNMIMMGGGLSSLGLEGFLEEIILKYAINVL